MPAYVIYARKSTESEDRQVLSIDSQVKELRDIAMRRGVQIGDVLTESHSAKAPGRPVFTELMRRVHKGRIAGIVCWKMDRLARNHLDTGAVLQALADAKIQEVITSDRTYTADGNDRFMGSFELGMATKYIDDLRANVKRGIRARLEQGWINYRPSPGYMIDPVTRHIIKDPERFEAVRRMMILAAEGVQRPAQILKIANEKWGFRTRKYGRLGGTPLLLSTFYRMLHDAFYVGVINLKDGRTYPGSHPPMLSHEEFSRIQAVIGRKGRPRTYKHHEFTFTGIFRCGYCGGGVRAEEHIKPSGKRYVYYRCTRNRAGVVCREPAIPEPELERQLATQLGKLTIPRETLNWLCKKAERRFVADEGRRQLAREALTRSVRSLEREEQTLLSLRVRELVDDATFVRMKREIENKRALSVARLEAPVDNATTQALLAFRVAAHSAQTFGKGAAVHKRMILEAVGLNYTLKSRKALWQLKNPFQIIAEAAPIRDWQALLKDVRTWFQDTTEYFHIPEEIMPKDMHIPPRTKIGRKRARRMFSHASSG